MRLYPQEIQVFTGHFTGLQVLTGFTGFYRSYRSYRFLQACGIPEARNCNAFRPMLTCGRPTPEKVGLPS